MKRAVVAALFAFVACPALADDSSSQSSDASSAEPKWQLPSYDLQQKCYTWIAIIAQYGEPDTIRSDWQTLALRIDDSIRERTDTPEDVAKPIIQREINFVSDWMIKYASATTNIRAKMLEDAKIEADACVYAVPPQN